MADITPTTNRPASGGGVTDRFTRKLGPLPVWAWAALILVGYFAYNHFKNAPAANTTDPNAPANPADTGTYVPPFDSTTGATGGAYGMGPPGPAGPPGKPGKPGRPGRPGKGGRDADPSHKHKTAGSGSHGNPGANKVGKHP
jgi:hypothetical protein